MSVSKLTTVVAATLALAGVAVWLNYVDRQDEGEQYLFPELTLEILNAVARVEMLDGDSAIHIHRAEDGTWRVTEHYDHPADTVQIRQLLSQLKDAVKIEQKTSSAEHYARLGVADADRDEGGGRLLKISTAEQSWQLLIGDPSRQVADGRYVRKPDEAASWLVNAALQLPEAADQWLDQDIVHLEPSEVSTITVTALEAEQPFVISRDRQGKLGILDLPEGKALKDAYKLNRVAAVADYLKFKAVFPRNDHGIELPERHITLRLMTEDDLKLTVLAYKTETGDSYFTLDAEGHSSRTAALQERLRGWLYQVSNSVYSSIDQRLNDLTKATE